MLFLRLLHYLRVVPELTDIISKSIVARVVRGQLHVVIRDVSLEFMRSLLQKIHCLPHALYHVLLQVHRPDLPVKYMNILVDLGRTHSEIASLRLHYRFDPVYLPPKLLLHAHTQPTDPLLHRCAPAQDLTPQTFYSLGGGDLHLAQPMV
jgi:hypothetical protein